MVPWAVCNVAPASLLESLLLHPALHPMTNACAKMGRSLLSDPLSANQLPTLFHRLTLAHLASWILGGHCLLPAQDPQELYESLSSTNHIILISICAFLS